jgi:hypothetical protein
MKICENKLKNKKEFKKLDINIKIEELGKLLESTHNNEQ